MKLIRVLAAIFVLSCSLADLDPASASMPPGHIHAAIAAYKAMPQRLQEIVQQNRNAYLLGCQGHDLAYWAPQSWWIKFLNGGGLYNPYSLYFKDKPGAFMHEGMPGQGPDSGRFIMRMLELATEQDRVYGEYPRASNAELAFTLGWISHWITDTHIHALVERYGGVYDTPEGQKRHVQLELLESKQVAAKHHISGIETQPDHRVFYFLSRTMRQFYPGSVYQNSASAPRLVSDGGVIPTYAVKQDVIPPVFVEMLDQGVFIISDAMACLRQSALSGQPTCDGWAKMGWNQQMDSQLVGQENYQRIMNPIEISLSPRQGSGQPIIDVAVYDYGLHGKFCVDWDRIMAMAIAAHQPVYNALDQAFAGFKPRDSFTDPVPQLPAGLAGMFPDIDILSPEKTANLLPRPLLDYFNDGAHRADPYPLGQVFYQVRHGDKTLASGKAQLKPMPAKDRPKLVGDLHHNLPKESSSIPGFGGSGGQGQAVPGVAEIELDLGPDAPPVDQLEVIVSLTDAAPLDGPKDGDKLRYEGVEFTVFKVRTMVALRLPGAVIDAFAGRPHALNVGLPANRLPAQPLFMWRISSPGGGAPQTINTTSPQLRHAFPTPGQYYVAVYLYDKKSGERQGAGSTFVTVNASGMGQGQEAVITQRQSFQEAQFIQAINAYPGANLEEKFQAYAQGYQSQQSQTVNYNQLLKDSMDQARTKYLEEHGQEMPPEMASVYERALKEQVGMFQSTFAEPPQNLYKPDKK